MILATPDTPFRQCISFSFPQDSGAVGPETLRFKIPHTSSHLGHVASKFNGLWPRFTAQAILYQLTKPGSLGRLPQKSKNWNANNRKGSMVHGSYPLIHSIQLL